MSSLGKVENAWNRFGSLINSGLIIFAGLGLVYAFGVQNTERDGKIQANANEIARVEKEEDAAWIAYHQADKDRLGEVKERDARYDQRFIGIEKDIRRIDQLEYRLGVQEQQQIATSAAIKETNNLLNGQSGDLKVMKEILQRLEANGRKDLR